MRTSSILPIVLLTMFAFACAEDTVERPTWKLQETEEQPARNDIVMNMEKEEKKEQKPPTREPDPPKVEEPEEIKEQPLPDPVPVEVCDGKAPINQKLTPGLGDTVNAEMTLDPRGRPHVVYYQEGVLRYAWSDGTMWNHEVVPAQKPGYKQAIWIEDTGKNDEVIIHIAYAHGAKPAVMLASKYPDGTWKTHTILKDWAWDINPVETPWGELMVAVLTSKKQYSGVGMDLKILKGAQNDWAPYSITRGEDVHHPGSYSHTDWAGLSFDSSGRALYAFSKNIGYRKGDPERPSNLWYAWSEAENLERWRHERSDKTPVDVEKAAFGHVFDDETHIFLYDDADSKSGLHQLVWRGNTWVKIPIPGCEDNTCGIQSRQRDRFGRLITLIASNKGGEAHYRLAAFDGEKWAFRELGAYEYLHALTVDQKSERVHMLHIERAGRDRELVYTTCHQLP